ncbi:unnamed protein product [Caenorhabditis angaria]|uniref:EF-hand domain-containing protein n=1 Tax=Caenorhabditis angaria TaxID=860376 RepID=A0A9P1MXC2_9PELO|nr:unnamed protein product [Caenorhabditis angaria]
MSGGGEDEELKSILEAQKSSSKSSTQTSIGFAKLPSIVSKSAAKTSESRRDSLIVSTRPSTTMGYGNPLGRIKTPLYPIPRANIAYNLNLNEIDENEVLRPTSSTSTVIQEIGTIPATFSEFRQFSADLDHITYEEISQIAQLCTISDEAKHGTINTKTLINAVKNVLIDEQSSSWVELIESIFLGNELVDYAEFFRVILEDKQSRDALVHLPEVLESDDHVSVFTELPSRPTSRQEKRERGRANLIIDLEVCLARNPHIEISRLKEATDKSVISVDEFQTILQMYIFDSEILDFESRIIDCFMTHDKMFCFSAFVGCLDQVKPHLLFKPQRQKTPSPPPWSRPALPKITSKLDDSGIVSDHSHD